MDELEQLRERLRSQRPVKWEQLPDLPLYMDQVLTYMDRQVLRFEDEDGLTAAMVNNYTKSGLLPRAEGKKYNREHLAYLTAICVLKKVLSAKDLSLILQEELSARQDVPGSYNLFCDSLDKSLNLITDVMEAYSEESDAADAAVHFALLSYAAGLASSRYVSLLREKHQAEEPEGKHRRSARKLRKHTEDTEKE